MNVAGHSLLDNLLIDTWWFGLSRRLDEETFAALARQRLEEGFTAVQLVVGIPPEVSPGHPEAQSAFGLPWDMQGNVNVPYLQHAQQRIRFLNSLGLRVIVYGGWGMQIEWTGTRFMQRWWQALIEMFDDLDVVYCVAGEVNIWIDIPGLLLPDKATDDLRGGSEPTFSGLRRLVEKAVKKVLRVKTRVFHPYADRHRRAAWGSVLKTISEHTGRPVLAHTGGGVAEHHSHNLIDNAELLSAVTVQTGHDRTSENLLWQLPMQLTRQVHQRFINLEPWYEGIRDDFYTRDQLYAYWCSMLGGACSFAYGAHGVWNVGDGQFLAHWGKQTLSQAMESSTPRLLGLSQTYFRQCMGFDAQGKPEVEVSNGRLVRISRITATGCMSFLPDIACCEHLPEGECFLPLRGELVTQAPENGPAVFWKRA